MSIKTKTKLTSVKIVDDSYNKFKHASLDENLNLQQLVNRTILMYVEDEEFRKQVNTYDDLKLSGSGF